MPYSIIIPARYASTRLPGKPLLDINGRCLLQHVHAAAMASSAESVIIATDDERIRAAAENFGAQVCMTRSDHTSGSERLAEVVDQLQYADDRIIVNLQGDEFGMPAALLDQVADLLQAHDQAAIATLCEPIQRVEEYSDPNNVKVVFDHRGRALYFSRSPIPWRFADAKAAPVFRHIGLYAYRSSFLRRYICLPAGVLEQSERLEQLRALEHGAVIQVAVAFEKPGLGIDTETDLVRARATFVNGEL